MGWLDTEAGNELAFTNPCVNVARALAGHTRSSPWPRQRGKHAKESPQEIYRAPTFSSRKGRMRIVHQRCGALDLHKHSITACVLVWDGREAVEERKKECGTYRKELERRRFWLMACRVTVVAMESAGVYWKPVWHVLERQRQFKLKLVKAQHFHGVDGQKSDPIDASWLGERLPCGLLRGSFVPPQWQRELRDLTRLRVSLWQDQNRIQNRTEKVLEDANLKLGGVDGRLRQRHAAGQAQAVGASAARLYNGSPPRAVGHVQGESLDSTRHDAVRVGRLAFQG